MQNATVLAALFGGLVALLSLPETNAAEPTRQAEVSALGTKERWLG